MEYCLTEEYRVDFTAYAPMHTFTGWCTEGIEAEFNVDFDTLTLNHLQATAKVAFFSTAEEYRTRAMMDYMKPDLMSEASITAKECIRFQKNKKDEFQISILAILIFMGIKRQLPISFTLKLTNNNVIINTDFKWSFKAYGLKAPRLLFLTVRDIVDIKGYGKLVPAKLKEVDL